MDISVIDAVYRALKHSDFEPITRLIENGNRAVLEDKSAREILVKKLRGESLRGRGRPKAENNPDTEERNNEIIGFIHFLNGYGLPITSTKKTGSLDAITIASEKFHLDPEHIRKEIWGKRRHKVTYGVSKELGEFCKQEGYKLEDLLPTD